MSSSSRIGGILLSVLLLAGCGMEIIVPPDKTNPGSDPAPYEAKGKAVYAPVDIPYLVENPIEIISITPSISNDHRREYFEISGLRDKTVEKSINEAVKLLYEQMLPYATGEILPPYRGIQTIAQPGGGPLNQGHLSVQPRFNCNNVLSVEAFVSGAYSGSGNKNRWFSVSECLNFDLNTGETFLLQDAFVNDVDGLAIVNDAIVKELRYPELGFGEEAGFTLASPFAGIEHEQKFFVDSQGINVVIDYNNPEFDVGFSRKVVTVPFYSAKGSIAITERFYDESQSIFTTPVAGKRFMYAPLEMKREEDSYHRDGMQWDIFVNYPEDLSQDLIEIIHGIRTRQEDLISQQTHEFPAANVGLNIYAQPMGAYVNISCHIYYSSEDKYQWQGSTYVYTLSGQRIELEALFAKGYAYEAKIKDALEKAILEHGYHSPDTEALYEDLEFSLGDAYLSFITQPYEWGPEGSMQPLSFSISYAEIGCENLTIFDH